MASRSSVAKAFQLPAWVRQVATKDSPNMLSSIELSPALRWSSRITTARHSSTTSFSRDLKQRSGSLPSSYTPFISLSSFASARKNVQQKAAFSTSSAAYVKRYTRDHEWIELDADGTTGTIGISTYAAKALGDVVYVELPIADTTVSAGDTIGAVESVKSASDILTPVSGTIVEANAVLEEKPGTINQGPEGEGWIAKIKVESKVEVEGLMGKEEYDQFTTE